MVGRLLFFLGELTDQTVGNMSQMVYVLKNEFAPKVKGEDVGFCFNSYIEDVKNLQQNNEINIFQI